MLCRHHNGNGTRDAMTIKIRDAGYQVIGYDVMTMPVDVTDNEGQQCTKCQVVGHVNTCTVTGKEGRFSVSVDCCEYCVVDMIRTVDASEPVTVEMTGEAFLAAYLRVVDVEGFTAYDGPIPVAGWTGVRPVADPLLDLLALPESDPWKDDRNHMCGPDCGVTCDHVHPDGA